MEIIDLLIIHAEIITMDSEDRLFKNGAIAVNNGQIVSVGEYEDLKNKYTGRQIWDANGKSIFPGFINTHTHLFQTLIKGLGKDLSFVDWLNNSVRCVMPHLDDEAIYLAAMIGCLEAVRTGTTTIVDNMYAQVRPNLSDEVIHAFEDLGIRGILARGMFDLKELPWGDTSIISEPIDLCLKNIDRLYARYKSHQLINIMLHPSAVWAMTEEGLIAAAEYSQENNLPITMHLLENNIDDEFCIEHYGKRTLPFLADIGFLSPSFIAVHGILLNSEDIKLFKQHQVKLSHNPVSNMILGTGIAPIPELLAQGIKVGLGTDGSASNDSQNLLEEMKITALLHKVNKLDASVMGAKEVLLMATRHGQKCLV